MAGKMSLASALVVTKPPIKKRIRLPRQTISFLDFPGEIRNMVYEESLVYDGEIIVHYIRGASISGFREPWRKLIRGQLLRLNRLVHQDARKILYGRNKFSLAVEAAWRFLRGPKCGKHQLSNPDSLIHLIQHIKLATHP